MSPTEKQIAFVEDICRVLRINDFPSSSLEYNKKEYSRFISMNIEEYNYVKNELAMENIIPDDLSEYVVNDVWTEFY